MCQFLQTVTEYSLNNTKFFIIDVNSVLHLSEQKYYC
jgi:hypothetical protein